MLVEEKQDFAEVKEDEDAGEEKGTGAAAGSENAAPGDEERRIKALEAELAESINDRRPKTMEEVDEVISSIYDALGDGGEGPLSKDDALFALGCGRVFEGTMDMMWASLSKLKALPPETLVYCAHEYTQANARFAETIETGNADLAAYIQDIDARRAKGQPTVPTRLEKELATNPFLRADVPELQAAMGHPGDAAATFAEIRSRKDSF